MSRLTTTGDGTPRRGSSSGRPADRAPARALPRPPLPEDQLGAAEEGDGAVALAGDARVPHLGRAAGMDAAGAALDRPSPRRADVVRGELHRREALRAGGQAEVGAVAA